RQKTNVESPEVTTSLSFSSQQNIQPVIVLSNGNPFLWQREYRSGKILGFAVPATVGWSNFPYKGIFVPLMYQSALFLASQINLAEASNTFFAGAPIEFSSSQLKRSFNEPNIPLHLADAQNQITPVQSISRSIGEGTMQTMYTSAALNELGQYGVLQNRDTVQFVSVNMRREESDGTLATKDQWTSVFEKVGIQNTAITALSPESDITQTVLQSRFGVELWKYFLLLAVIIALIEMIVAREKKEL
ncbi:MAG: hypothetical protein PHP42_12840, partial [Bacteroidota bacterium]|nr:hypothetical protein [Bacteroidota bacterium]